MIFFPVKLSLTHISGPGRTSVERWKAASRARPRVVVAVRGATDGLTHLALLAVTMQPPQPDRAAIEVPETEARRAGLSDLKRCWVIVDEYNYDVAERSWYIEPDQNVLGRFSKAFMMKIASSYGAASGKSARRVNRLG